MQLAQQRTKSRLTESTPDGELVQRACAGDESAFEAIMRRYNGRLFRTARSIMSSDTEAEEVLQDAYLQAWRALADFRAQAQLSTWLVRIVINEALGRLRRKQPSVVSLDVAMSDRDPDVMTSLVDEPAQAPDRIAMHTQLRRLLEARIDLLPEIFRTVFMLRAVEEMSVEEVAQALEIPQATVRTRYFRARNLMRESLASEIDKALTDAFAFDGERCDRIVVGVLARGRTAGLSRTG